MALPRMLAWILLAVMFAFALGTYGSLPDVIPTGIDADGSARGLREKSLWLWLAVPLLTLVVTALMTVIREMLPTRPHLFNFPDKDRFLKLPARYRPPVVAEMQLTMDVIGAITILPMIYVQYLMWETARGNTVELGVLGLTIGAIFIAPAILLVAGRVTTATDVAEKRWRADGQPAE